MSELVGLIASVVVGLSLVAAGIFKLLDGAAWPRQAADMGVGRSVASVVPWVELTLGATTVGQFFAPWPAVASAMLLLAFTILIGIRIRDGSRPPCACFGRRSARPLGASHVLRNLTLIALAGLAIWAS